MLVREWMSRSPVTVAPETSVLNARRIMLAHNIRHLPVVDGEQVVGILSDRDVMVGEVPSTQVASILQSEVLSGRYRSVGTVMSAPALFALPDQPVRLALNQMLAWNINALPVVEDGRLVGILTTTDCLRALNEQLRTAPAEPDDQVTARR